MNISEKTISPGRPDIQLFHEMLPCFLVQQSERVSTEIDSFPVDFSAASFGVGDLEFITSPAKRIVGVESSQLGGGRDR